MRLRTLVALVALIALALLLTTQPGPASASHNASRTFVSTTGNDANPCSAAAPCRSFAVALGHTAAGGEILAVDSGGYGPVTITKSVAIVGAPGAHVAITATSGNAITVAAGGSDQVILRNLYLTGLGAVSGVQFTSGAALYVERLVASGFAAGVAVNTSASSATYISDTTARNNSSYGFYFLPGSSATATVTITRARAENNTAGGFVTREGSRVTVRDSVASGNDVGFTTQAFGVGTLAQMSIEQSTASGNVSGILVGGGGGTSVVDVSNSTITYNGTGIGILDVISSAWSRVNNTVERNTSNGAFSGPITPK